MAKVINTPDAVVRIEKSGVRFNAWDTDGNKRTSEITTTARKKAFNGDYLLGRFTNKSGNYYWRQIDGNVVSDTSTTASTTSTDSVEVPTDHEEVLNFIHNSYSLKPKGLVMKELKWKYFYLCR